jgi:hypothetical protein
LFFKQIPGKFRYVEGMRKMEKETDEPLAGGRLEELFKAYFNNRMMILLMVIEHPEISREVLSIERQRFFLNDLYHHFLPPNCASKYRRAIDWLFRFLNIYPNVKPSRIYRAIQMVTLVYEAFGLKLSPRVEARRLEKESLGGGKDVQKKTGD